MRGHSFLKSRTAAFVALICIAAATAIAGTHLALRVKTAFDHQHQRIEQGIARLARYRAQAQMRPALENRLKQMEKTADSLPRLLKSDSAKAASTQIQGDLKAIVQKNRGEIRTMQNLPAVEMEGFEQVAVKSSVVIPITSLKDVVLGVESHTPYYFVREMTVTGPREWPANVKTAPEPKLQIDWIVYGLRRSVP